MASSWNTPTGHGVDRQQRDGERERAERGVARHDPARAPTRRPALSARGRACRASPTDSHGVTGTKMAAVGSSANTRSSGGVRVDSERADSTPYDVVPMTYVGL